MKHFYKLKQVWLMCSFSLLAVIGLQAQINQYGFTPLSGSFTPLVAGTATSLTATADDALSTAFPIGFNFTFGGIVYTTVKASSNGVLNFNATGSSTTTNNLATTTTAIRPGLAPLWDDIQCTAGVTYQLNGVAPNRTLTVEWLNMEWNFGSTTPVISFQVILYETTNVIDFVYRQEATAVATGSASIGLMGTATTDYLSLQNTSASPTVSTTASTNTLNVKPATGQIYRFTPPPATPPTPVQDAAIPSCATGTTLDVVGTPEPGVVWYWQTSATGTSTADPYAGPFTVFANGTYYMRAYNSSVNLWSTNSSSVIVSNFPVATAPPAPVAAQNPSCAPTGTTISVASAPAGYMYYWQGTNSTGSDNTLDAANPYSVTSTGTYYVAAYETATQCWSPGVGVTVTVSTTTPPAPSTTTAEYFECTGISTLPLTVTGVNTIEWYDAATGGQLLGTGATLDAVGTIEMPAAVTGIYEFYAVQTNGCVSPATLITVNINAVSVTLTPLDVTCNGAANGSFIISAVDCGTGPYSYSVDGGAFGPAPSNLTAGTYTVIVRDVTTNTSAPYTVVIAPAPAPFGIVMDITDNGGQVSWNAGAGESNWNVEYGLPGFVPGTGNEIGSMNVNDTFAIITGLDANTNYDVFVSADCGTGQTIGTWITLNFTTDCGIYGIPFTETFEDNSATRVCWTNEQEVGTANWTYATGSSGGTVTTAYQGTKNARFVSASGTGSPITKLVSPRLDLSGQDSVAVIFAYAQEDWAGDQNVTKVYLTGSSSVWTEVQSYTTNVNAWTMDTLFVSDTVTQIAFEGINNWGRANVIDHVQFLPCSLTPGTDGNADVCRLEGTFDLNTIVTLGEDFGSWSFPTNETFLNGSVVDIALLPAGSYEFFYIVKTPCAADTTVATLTIYDASTAGNDGQLDVCLNEPFDLLAGLSGTVNLGGTWYDPSNNPMSDSQINGGTIPGQFNYDYITGNGVCPNDTAVVLVVVDGSCDYLNVQEMYFSDLTVYPNPSTGLINIVNTGSELNYNIKVTDVHGRKIVVDQEFLIGSKSTTIDLTGNPIGMYFIELFNENAKSVIRIVLQ